KQYTVHIITGFIYSLKLRRCIFPVNPVDFHFCENDQKNSHPHHVLFPPDATKTSTNITVLRPHYVLLKP
ncbi:hypothetical protein, partial [Pseudomonas aeruginosa]|uniref:hypothetical protein n=1 Tax=Pseudomonas aeruginosa TaxID=287 RepID=UPI001C52C20B